MWKTGNCYISWKQSFKINEDVEGGGWGFGALFVIVVFFIAVAIGIAPKIFSICYYNSVVLSRVSKME